MSQIELKALETNFENWRRDRVPDLAKDKAFERYAVEQILKDYAVSDEDISSGMCGGDDDGGVDALYFFAGNRIIREDIDISESASAARLLIVQATFEKGGFKETRMEKFDAFTRDLLDYNTDPSCITHLNPRVRGLIKNFRDKYEKMLSTPHTLEVTFHYAAKTTEKPNSKLDSRFKRTVGYVKRQLTNADVTWEPWDCSRLLKKVREEPEQRIPVEVTRHFTTPNGDVVCLAGLPEFFAFLKGTDGQLRTGVLEPNVRDYQGKRNLVNKDIRETLDFSPVKEFWWLNNGITILAEDCPINGNKVTLVRPEVVNGLQTSHEIFNFFKEHPERLDGETRSIIMRVIRPPDEQTSSKITKATNFQTEVKGLSLHASEKIHFDIEDKLLFSNLYYDRKKGKYKRLKKPISQIVSVIGLARSVIAILLRRPNDARARPQTLLTDDDTYLQIFSREFDVDLYLACITIDRRVESFLEGYPSSRIQDEEKRDIRYYLDMWLACEVTSSSAPSPSDLAQKVESCKALPDATIERACKRVLKRYRKLGGTEQIAKGPELSRSLQKSLSWLFRKS